MPRCCVGGCDNDTRYPNRYIIHSNVDKSNFKLHYFPRNDIEKRKQWTDQVLKGRNDFQASNETRICSNHFVHFVSATEGGPIAS